MDDVKLPVISEKTNLSLDEAKAEYKELLKILNVTEFPDGGTGWASWLLNRIDARLTFLRTLIADIVCKE